MLFDFWNFHAVQSRDEVWTRERQLGPDEAQLGCRHFQKKSLFLPIETLKEFLNISTSFPKWPQTLFTCVWKSRTHRKKNENLCTPMNGGHTAEQDLCLPTFGWASFEPRELTQSVGSLHPSSLTTCLSAALTTRCFSSVSLGLICPYMVRCWVQRLYCTISFLSKIAKIKHIFITPLLNLWVAGALYKNLMDRSDHMCDCSIILSVSCTSGWKGDNRWSCIRAAPLWDWHQYSWFTINKHKLIFSKTKLLNFRWCRFIGSSSLKAHLSNRFQSGRVNHINITITIVGMV